MGNVGITLSTSDPAGANMLERFRDMGFSETGKPDVLKLDEMILIAIEHLIVPEERYKVPAEPDPYPADYDALARTYDLDYLVVASRHASRSRSWSRGRTAESSSRTTYCSRSRRRTILLTNPSSTPVACASSRCLNALPG